MIIQLIREALRCSCASNIMLLIYRIVTVRNFVADGNNFTGVCLSTGVGWGCLPQSMLGYHTPPPGPDTPPWTRHPPPWSRHHPWDQTPPWTDTPLEPDTIEQRPPPHPPTRYGHCCGRYASYWNAFLFNICLLYWYKVDFWRKFFPREWKR